MSDSCPGLSTKEIYTNGTGNSLPIEIQLQFLRTIEGLEDVEIIRPGYAIEYDFVFPTQLKLSLETKLIEGLFLAGQLHVVDRDFGETPALFDVRLPADLRKMDVTSVRLPAPNRYAKP